VPLGARGGLTALPRLASKSNLGGKPPGIVQRDRTPAQPTLYPIKADTLYYNNLGCYCHVKRAGGPRRLPLQRASWTAGASTGRHQDSLLYSLRPSCRRRISAAPLTVSEYERLKAAL